MTRIFDNFSEVEDDFKATVPPVVYKYRTWKDEYHKKLLTQQQAWFSHPFDLNDKLDVRPETVFDTEEFGTQEYLQKMIRGAQHRFPDLSPTEQEFKAIEQWEKIKKDPGIVIMNRQEQTIERSNYDPIGVFSTSQDDLNSKLWQEYGGAHRGYCLGLNTVLFFPQTKSSCVPVIYSDAPYKYSFLKDDDYKHLQWYLKKTSWQYENEYRFITAGIGKMHNGEIYAKNAQIFSTDAVAELILGYDIPAEDEKEIVEIFRKLYPPHLPIYKTKVDESGKLTKGLLEV